VVPVTWRNTVARRIWLENPLCSATPAGTAGRDCGADPVSAVRGTVQPALHARVCRPGSGLAGIIDVPSYRPPPRLKSQISNLKPQSNPKLQAPCPPASSCSSLFSGYGRFRRTCPVVLLPVQ
jgi:hypothetical protein